jgi:hypothetical protein
LSYQAGQATKLRIAAGQHLRVHKSTRSNDASTLELPDNLIATRHGEDLVIRYADGGTVTLANFYGSCSNKTVCSINLVGDTDAGVTLSGEMAAGANVSDDGGTLVYAHGNQDVLMSMAQGQPALSDALVALGNVPVLTYLPTTSVVGAVADTSFAMGFASIPALISASILFGAGAGSGGTSASDGNTNVATVNLTGIEANATWQYQVDGGAWTPGTGATFSLGDGSHTYAVRQTDLAGNLGNASGTSSYTLNTTAPTATIATYTDNVGTGAAAGNFGSRTITDDTTPVLNGTVSLSPAGNNVVQIYDGASLLGNATVTGGNWTYATPTLTDRSTHSYTAIATDAAGNAGAASSAFTLTVSTSYEKLSNATIKGGTSGAQVLSGWSFNSTAGSVFYFKATAQGASGICYFNGATNTAGGLVHQTVSNLMVGQVYTLQYEAAVVFGNVHNTMVSTVYNGAASFSGASWTGSAALGTATDNYFTTTSVLHSFNFTATSTTATVVFRNTFAASTSTTGFGLRQASVMTQDEVARHTATPLLLDLNGDGVQTVSVDNGVLFDIANTGTLARTGWANANDGLLVRDINHDGSINNGAELFGNGTLLADGSHAANGFAALAQFDSNQDEKIDVQDAVFQELKVWRDANGDGVSQPGELLGLKELGIASFNLNAATNTTGDNGNLHGLVSSYTTTDGAVHDLADVWFQQGAQFTLDTDASGLTTLHLGANTPTLDLSTVDTTRLQGLKVIDLLTNQSADNVSLGVQQVLDLGQVNWINSLSTALTGGSYHFDSAESRHQLLVTGDAADRLTTTGGFVDTRLTAILSGHTYEVYNQGNYAQLLVEQVINRSEVL